MQTFIRYFVIAYIFTLIFFLIKCYPRIKCWFYAFKPQERLENSNFSRLAVLIPARNESMSVGTLFDCLNEQSYPKELFDVHVVVADAEDKTVNMARQYGFIPHIVTSQTCKSDALDACFKSIFSRDVSYDAYIIVDADCALDKHFLREMNNALASGADIICSAKRVKNYHFGNKKVPMSAACNGLIWTFLDSMGNKYKSMKGHPCFTVGTGLMLRADLISELGGWPYKQTLTEDAELMHDCTLSGKKFFYYEYAVLYMEEAPNLKETNKRRRRWLGGVVDCDRIYRDREKAQCTPESRYYASALNHIYGYVGTSVIFGAVSLLISIFFGVLHISAWRSFAAISLGCLAVLYISFLITTVVGLCCDGKHMKMPLWRKIALMFVHPLFYMQYITIIGKALLFPEENGTWEVIERVDFSKS